MDTKDLSEAGAFIDPEIWDKFIIKQDPNKMVMKPKDYTK